MCRGKADPAAPIEHRGKGSNDSSRSMRCSTIKDDLTSHVPTILPKEQGHDPSE